MSAPTVSLLTVPRHLSDRQPKPRHALNGCRLGTVEEMDRSGQPIFSDIVLGPCRRANHGAPEVVIPRAGAGLPCTQPKDNEGASSI